MYDNIIITLCGNNLFLHIVTNFTISSFSPLFPASTINPLQDINTGIIPADYKQIFIINNYCYIIYLKFTYQQILYELLLPVH